MKNLTEKQKKIYDFIISTLEDTSRLPSLTEIARHFSFNRSRAFTAIEALIKKGVINRNENGYITLCDEERVKLINKKIKKADGGFSYANIEDEKEEYFSMMIFSDEMKNIGLLSGDEGIFKRCDSAKSGDIVLCRLGEEERLALRRLIIRSDGLFELVPENDSMGKTVSKEIKIEARLIKSRRTYV